MTIRYGLAPLLVLLALTGCTSEAPAAVQVADVRRGPVTEVVEAPATIGARASATLRSPARGTIAKLYVRDGDRVRKGQIVARIRSPQAEGQLRQARQASRMATPARVGAQLLNAIDLARSQYRAQTRALASITAQLNRSISGLVTGVTSGL
ncbi:efflux RND transporter periplasmic adaptor subunit [Nonomuraea gerenzanensis]|uniref:biotin/lipoyl-binding protein n=1 Tax=Nonomuraea gerenzanensis TaxID=93944 RepID=UPI001CD91FBC|nr:biotin/lipoyl-binding protein [Nonomuraea gerenzanensis]UBU13856.1 biotin/lipoyl-binding protein [Nonomuraea gerenzanensis]